MASFDETIRILIKADGMGAVRELEKVGKTAERELGKASKSTRNWGATFTKAGVGLVTGSVAVGAGLFKMAAAAEESERANLQLQNTLKNAPQLTGRSAKAFTDLATSIRKTTVVDDEAVIGIEAFLGAVGRTQSEILTLTPLIVDLSRKTGVDLDAAAKAVNKSVDGTARGLRALGVDIDSAAVKTDGFGATVDALRSSVGGFAQEEGKTFSGQVARLKNEFGELSEGIGSGVVESLQTAIGPLTAVSQKFQELDPETQGLIGKFGGFAVAATGLVGVLSVFAGQATKVRDALTQVGDDGTRSLNKLGKAAAGLAAVGAAVELGAVLKDIFVGQEQSTAGLEGDLKKMATSLYSVTGTAEDTAESIKALDREFAAFVTAGPAVENLGLAALQQDIDDGTISAKQLNDALTGTKEQFEAFRDIPGLFSDTSGITEWRAQLERAAKETVTAQRAAGDYSQAQVDTALASTRAKDGTNNYQAALRLLVDDLETGKRKTDDLREAQDRLFERATERRDEILGQRDAQRAVTQAQLDAAQAVDDLSRAQADYNAAVKEHGKDSVEARDAQRDLQRAFLEVASTSDGAKQAVLDYAESLGGTKADAPAQKIQNTITKLEDMRDSLAPGSPLRKYLDDYIAALREGIPPEVSTDLIIRTRRDDTGRVNNARDLSRDPAGDGTGKAIGGPVSPNYAYPVGERGPELFRPSVPGVIIPNNRLRGGDGYTAPVTITINAGLGTDPTELERAVTQALANARRRGVQV